MVYRIFVEKREELQNEALSLLSDINTLLGIESVKAVRVINRYDVEGIDKTTFDYASRTVFSEPQLDVIFDEIKTSDDDRAFAVEYLPGQFDQRADSAAQCIQLLTAGECPRVASAKVVSAVMPTFWRRSVKICMASMSLPFFFSTKIR